MNDGPSDPRDPAAGSPAGGAGLPAAPVRDPNLVPRDTSPTWQSELLLSGGVVFALFQLPPLIDAGMSYFRPRLGQGGMQLLVFLYLYSKIAVLALIIAFTAHLALRALWIALVGLNSVFPNGVDWSRIKSGPHGLEASKRIHVPLPRLIDRTDNVSTMVFALGTLIALMGAGIGAMTLALIGGGLLLRWLFGLEISVDTIMFGFVAVVVGALLLAQAVDRLFGARVGADSLTARILRAVVTGTNRFAMGRTASSMLMTFISNVGQRKELLVVMGSLYALIAYASIDRAVDTGALSLASEAYLPHEGKGGALDPRHDADQRDETTRYSLAPFVPSLVAKGPYLPLFVPYDPEDLPPRLAATCPDLSAERLDRGTDKAQDEAQRDEAARVVRLIACKAALYDVRLDGALVALDSMRIHTDPASGLRGLLVMIPAWGLARGAHTLSLNQLPDHDAPPDAAPPEPHEITFWR